MTSGEVMRAHGDGAQNGVQARRLRVGVLATHPIQYYSPWYRALARSVDLEVFFSHRQSAEEQAAAGFGVEFDWDVPLLDGFQSTFLENAARRPSVNTFWGCHTPDIGDIIRRRGFDAFIVHGWYTRSFWQAMTACWRARTRPSSCAATRAFRRRAPAGGGSSSARSSACSSPGSTATSSSASARVPISCHYGADPDRCFPAPHAVDNEFFASRAERARLDRPRIRSGLGLPDSAVVFLFTGRFIDRKRPEMFVRAVAAAAKQTARPIAGLMVGDGPLRKETESLVERLGAPVRFAGFLNQTEIVRAYVASDVLVVPSTWETWGLVVNEAMACGLPAVVTEGVGCAGDLVAPGVTGEVVPVDAGHDLTARIVRLAEDAEYRGRLSAEAPASRRELRRDGCCRRDGPRDSRGGVAAARGAPGRTRGRRLP